MAFQRFPLAMSHPHHVPAVISIIHVDVNGNKEGKTGSPAKFPPVFVNNEDQEKQYASQGYVPNGTPDVDAYLRATIGSHIPEDHKFADFPKYLHQATKNDKGDITVESKLFNTKAEADKLDKSWCRTPDDAKEYLASFKEGKPEVNASKDVKTEVVETSNEPETIAAPPKNKGGRPKKLINQAA
jgi:hypothetical protein